MRRVQALAPRREEVDRLREEDRLALPDRVVASNILAHQGLSAVPGSGQAWFLDALYRDHAEVEDRVKAIKRIELGLLPSKS